MASPSASSSGKTASTEQAPVITCPSVGTNTLQGAGQVEVIVTASEYETTLKAANNETPRLSLNGFDMGKGAVLLTTEHVPDGRLTVRFQLQPHDDSKAASNTLYEEFGLMGRSPLRVALIWGKKENPAVVFMPPTTPSQRPLHVAVTGVEAVAVASLLSLIMVLFFWWAVSRTDIFRSGSSFVWWADARALRKQLRKGLGLPRGHAIQLGTPPVLSPVMVQVIQANKHGGVAFDGTTLPTCMVLARNALEDNYPPTDADASQTVIGLALQPTKWKQARPAFSLSSMQVGIWVMFAAVTGVFLWLVYWQLPKLTGSLLILAVIAGGTATASWLVDPTAKAFVKSQNFLADLVTGNDGGQRVHRFQAVLINALLLFVGIFEVIRTLNYPTFDPSWLQFLGLSGILQTAGKKILEPPSSGTPAGTIK